MVKLTTKIFAILFLIFASLSYAEAQDASIYELPVGTLIRVQMDNGINSKVSSVDDTFTATVIEPVLIRGAVVVPVGSVVEGSVESVKRAEMFNKNGVLILRFNFLRFKSGEERKIVAELNDALTVKNDPVKPVAIIAGGAGVGALLGSLARSGKGSFIGAAVGAGAGTALTLASKGKEAVIGTDEKFTIRLNENVTLPVRDF